MGRKEAREMYLVMTESGDYCYCESLSEAKEFVEAIKIILERDSMRGTIYREEQAIVID